MRRFGEVRLDCGHIVHLDCAIVGAEVECPRCRAGAVGPNVDHVRVGESSSGVVWWAHREPGETDVHLSARAADMRQTLAATEADLYGAKQGPHASQHRRTG
jgi:hypothetical protein